MQRSRRQLNAFTLSFLDVMCCGFGVMVLLFLIIKHNITPATTPTLGPPDLSAEVNLLEEEVLDGRQGLAVLRNTIAEVDEQTVVAEGLARRIMEQIRAKEGGDELLAVQAADEEIEALQTRIQQLEDQKQGLEQEAEKAGDATRTFEGEGTRQYLTGISVGGQRIVLLVDASASMLDETVVNVIRRRNMDDKRKLQAPKWKQATATVDWLTTRFPPASSYQIYLFNTDVKSAVPGTEGRWLKVNDLVQLNGAVEAVRRTVPGGGTSLQKAFAAARALTPQPDNIYIVTDGLPTQGQRPPRFGSKVSGKDRLNLFRESLESLPADVPVHTILLPMEGDPTAAHSFWGLAIMTGGTFMCPAKDWP
jgi:hypothetical protein